MVIRAWRPLQGGTGWLNYVILFEVVRKSRKNGTDSWFFRAGSATFSTLICINYLNT